MRSYLIRGLGFTHAEVARIDTGEGVSRVIESRTKNQIVIAGVVRLDVPVDFFLEQYRNI